MYIDAGTGSMLLQVGAALFFTVLLFFRQLFGWTRGLSTLRPRKTHDDGEY